MTSPATRPSSSSSRAVPPFNLQIPRGLPRVRGDGMFEGSRDSLPRASRNKKEPLCERCDSIFAGVCVVVLVKRLWVLLGLLAMAPAFGAELKIGYVNAARLMDESPQAGEVSKRLKEEFSGKESELQAGQKKLKQMGEQIARDGAVMSESERRKLERDMDALKRDLSRTAGEFREDLNLRRNEEVGKLLEFVQQTIEGVAKEKGYDLIVYEGVAYASPTIDLTDKVLEKLRTPASAGAAKK